MLSGLFFCVKIKVRVPDVSDFVTKMFSGYILDISKIIIKLKAIFPEANGVQY